jgi:hypothetical protein
MLGVAYDMASELLYVQLVQMDNGEVWFFKLDPQGWVPHRRVTSLYDGEIVEKPMESIVS